MRADEDLIPKGLKAEVLSIHRERVDISSAPSALRAKCHVCDRPSRRAHGRYAVRESCLGTLTPSEAARPWRQLVRLEYLKRFNQTFAYVDSVYHPALHFAVCAIARNAHSPPFLLGSGVSDSIQ